MCASCMSHVGRIVGVPIESDTYLCILLILVNRYIHVPTYMYNSIVCSEMGISIFCLSCSFILLAVCMLCSLQLYRVIFFTCVYL